MRQRKLKSSHIQIIITYAFFGYSITSGMGSNMMNPITLSVRSAIATFVKKQQPTSSSVTNGRSRSALTSTYTNGSMSRIDVLRRRSEMYRPCSYELTSDNFDLFQSEDNKSHSNLDPSNQNQSFECIQMTQEECNRSLVAMADNSNILLDGVRGFNKYSIASTLERPSKNRRTLFTSVLKRRDPSTSTTKKSNADTLGINIVCSTSKNTSQLDPVSTATVVTLTPTRKLLFWENMICGATSRSIAQTVMHPANTMKTILQSNRGKLDSQSPMTVRKLAHPKNFKILCRGAGAQFLMSVPHGAINFAVLEYVRRRLNTFIVSTEWGKKQSEKTLSAYGPTLDFLSSAISTITCSIVSTPQMMITDNIMAGTYPNLLSAMSGLTRDKGLRGFYSGWWPGLAGKIPSYALTWTLFQQLKEAQLRIFKRPPSDIENSIMGCLAGATTVCVMIPMDTIKTRLVTQMNYPDLIPYKGIVDCAMRITKEEGLAVFYRGLTPRLISVVPMIGIQFGVYEFMKKVMIARSSRKLSKKMIIQDQEREKLQKIEKRKRIEEVIMEVAADDDQPFPAPYRFDDNYLINKDDEI